MKNLPSKALYGVGATLLLAGCGGESKPNIAIGPPASTTQSVSQLLFEFKIMHLNLCTTRSIFTSFFGEAIAK